jgi:hypothetical protein
MSSQAQPSARPIDHDKLNALLGQAVQDMGASLHAALILIGDKLGLYRAMADGNPVTPAELAAAERYVREWLNANAAGNYGWADLLFGICNGLRAGLALARGRARAGSPGG